MMCFSPLCSVGCGASRKCLHRLRLHRRLVTGRRARCSTSARLCGSTCARLRPRRTGASPSLLWLTASLCRRDPLPVVRWGNELGAVYTRLAVASADMTMRVIEGKWGWGETDDGPSNAFMQALRHTAGIQFQPDGQLAYLTAEQLTQAQAEITAFLQAPAPPKAKWQHAILTWAAMMPEKRTTSPWTTEPLRVAAGRWFMQASGTVASFITDTADGAPWHPLEPISLARLEPKPDDKADAAPRETLLIRPRFLARLTLQRLREADETLYGRATLAEYATWCAKILRAELHFEAEAQEALELKAKLEAK